MVSKEERLRRLCSAPTETGYAEVAAVLEAFGWHEARQTGSHHHWKGPLGRTVSVPTAGGRRVKRIYLKELCRLIQDAESAAEQATPE